MDQLRAFAREHWERWSALEIDDVWFAGKRCLDAGCGSGRAALSLAERGAAHVVAMDLAGGALERAKQLNAPFPQVRVLKASVLDLPFPDASFDFVHCNGVLHHTPDPRRGFAECVRVLAPGGWFAIGLYGSGGLVNLAVDMARLLGRAVPVAAADALIGLLTGDPIARYAMLDSIYVPIRRTYRRAEVERWFAESGLKDVRSLDSRWSFYRWGRFWKGDGYLLIQARKPVVRGA